MPKTQAAKDLRHERTEEAIEELLAKYPYLIGQGLPRPQRQLWITNKDRVDLLFTNELEILIVEIKGTACNAAAVQQLMRYVQILATKHAEVRGLLIGPRLTPRGMAAMGSCQLNIAFLQLDVDVPSSVLTCRECRLAYGARLADCPNCGSTQTI